jgi:hypothetical protein
VDDLPFKTGVQGGVKRNRSEASLCANAFLALCSRKEVSRKELTLYLKDKFPVDARKAGIFLQRGITPSVAVRDALIAFARDRMGVPLNYAWFDMDWHPSALIDEFVFANSQYKGILDNICGRYFHISTKIGSEDVRYGQIVINDHPGGAFSFAMGNLDGVSKGSNPSSGFLLCHSESLFLVGFDKEHHAKVMFSVLRRPGDELAAEGVRLYGLLATTLPLERAENGRAIAKRIALIDYDSWVQKWGDGTTPQQGVKKWLLGGGPGFDIELACEREED